MVLNGVAEGRKKRRRTCTLNGYRITDAIWECCLIDPESRKIATDARVVQNSRRLVVSESRNSTLVKLSRMSHSSLIDRSDHMIFIVPSIVHNHEPDLVWGNSSYPNRRVLRDGIRLAIAISHRDRFKGTGPVARRGLDQKIN